MSTTNPPSEQPVVSARQLPRPYKRIPDPLVWEVRYGDEVIGWVEQRSLRGARNTFYFATGVHPHTGKHYRLEGSIDFDERVNTIADFHLDPNSSRQHLGVDPGHPAKT